MNQIIQFTSDQFQGIAGRPNIENWECEQIFFNEPLIILDDPKHSYAEKRRAAFGKTDAGKLLTVVFAKRGSLIRVISARAMKRKERNFYAKYQ